MNDKNIENFEQINEKQIIEKIRNKATKTISEIERLFNYAKDDIYYEINHCDGESDFERIVDINERRLNRLRDDVNRICREFKGNLEKINNNEIINKLNLKEFKEEKRKFEKAMKNFREANMCNDVSNSASTYIESSRKWYCFFAKRFNKEKTLDNYRSRINRFFSENEIKSKNIVNANKNDSIKNITEIIEIFKNGIKGYEGKIETFQTKLFSISVK